jgi:hypothetical protein
VKLRFDLKSAHYRLYGLYAAQGRHEQARRELEIFRSLR